MFTQPQELPRSAKAKPTCRRSVFGAAWLTGFLLLAAWLGFGSPRLPWSSRGPSAPASLASSASPRTKPIEEIQLGDRVLGRNPLREQVDESLPEPDAATWRCLKLRLQKQDGLTLWVHLLRPLSWIEASGVKPGGTFYLDLPEMGAVGDAQVESIGPCPPIKPGKGSVITGRFIHETNGQNVVAVSLEDEAEPTHVTDNHPYWSEDRNEFVPASELQRGERVSACRGSTRVLGVARNEREGLLYNLEIHSEHVFRVGASGALVHNSCPKSFRIRDWSGYPENLPRPRGRVRLLEGAEYEAARNAANAANRKIHAADSSLAGKQIHEIKPVKFGGSPTNPRNKIPLSGPDHAEVTSWWNSLMRSIIGD